MNATERLVTTSQHVASFESNVLSAASSSSSARIGFSTIVTHENTVTPLTAECIPQLLSLIATAETKA